MPTEAEPAVAPILTMYLAAVDAPCPACGYNLRGLWGTRCPECNQELVLRVGLAEPKMAAWVTGLVGLACGVGFHGLLLVYFSVMVWFRPMGDWYHFLLLTAPFFVIEGAALLVWVRRRGRFQRLSPAGRAWLVGGSWALTLAGFAMFTVFIR